MPSTILSKYFVNFQTLLLLLVICERAFSVTQYKKCADVKKDLGSKAKDGEYILYLKNRVGVSIYCHNLQSTTDGPAEFLTLKAGGTANFAQFYENVGYKTSCADKSPQETYENSGRSEFQKISINMDSLAVDTSDLTFAKTTGKKKVSYATAGDKWSYSPKCSPKGVFQIDLSGTPFVPVRDTDWQWIGNYANGDSTLGKSILKKSNYKGCYADRSSRLLPAARWDDNKNQTPNKCIRHCRNKGFKYAGLEYGVECHCGNNYKRYGPIPSLPSRCAKPCSGDPKQSCGGLWFVSVYSTAYQQRFTGECGGYPGQCFPINKRSPSMERLELDLMNGEHICLKKNPCKNEAGCFATSGSNYKCICHEDYSGTLCDVVTSVTVLDGQTCPPGTQAESCMCRDAENKKCKGAKFSGDNCVAASGNPKVLCRPGLPGHVILFNVDGTPTARCPDGAEMVGCSFWSSTSTNSTDGQGVISGGTCSACETCKVQARCKQYMCGCKNGGDCNKVTGQCHCPLGYYGEKCETFDYCSYYESQHNNTKFCKSGGICTPVHKNLISATGGDMAGDTCMFPFDFKDDTYNSCINDNTVGPPFACAGEFHQSKSYIDLGPWSPGPQYTIAAWVRPEIIDTIRRTVVGGVSECNDIGFNLNSGTFRAFNKLSKMCTRDLDAGKPYITVGQWYMVAVTCNATHLFIYQNGEYRDFNTVLMNNLATTSGMRIGGEVCCPMDYFHGMIKTVKIWNRFLTQEQVNKSMYSLGIQNSTTEAIHDGLVAHYELGYTGPSACTGVGAIDHGGENWLVKDGQFIGGLHCNISRFIVPKGATVLVTRFNGTSGGTLDVTAKDILIHGYINAVGAGYNGGVTSKAVGDGGQQGQSPSGIGTISTQENRGGGGGGIGGSSTYDGTARSGGGGGYGTKGSDGIKVVGSRTGLGTGGRVYGDEDINDLYIGSGGGSGGNAKDLRTNPPGGRGGNGGGAIKLMAQNSVIITGVLSVAGGTGQGDALSSVGCMKCPDSCELKSPVRCLGNSTTACWDMSAPGGGGSGGSIYISAKLVDIGYQKLWAMGGDGGAGGNKCCGGKGGAGRIRIDAVVQKGVVGETFGTIKTHHLDSKFVDHSQVGQKQINYRTTTYGNEVYRGCFKLGPPGNTTLAAAMTSTFVSRSKMTPKFCQNYCRQNNYKFSGTEGGVNCYCDNHLDTSNKVADSKCNSACHGDPMQKCGGKEKLQIFGPPPGGPATSHNVLPKCQPWCVTADRYTSNPKWGLCADKPYSVANWEMQCQCPPGKLGVNCGESCSAWTYGNSCRRNCTCNTNNTAQCNPSNGVCFCKPGYQGKTCENACDKDHFGQDCAQSCNCSHNSQCDKVTGKCSCQPGWSGDICNFPCAPNKYGSQCNLTCECFHGTCEPTHGMCNCDPGYKLPTCFDKCDPSNYGQECLQSCDCNDQSCDPFSGSCICGPGYIGPKCETRCPHGTWGQACAKKCTCINTYSCDHMTGECRCGAGFMGERCEIPCQSGSYGSGCLGTCPCKTCSAIDGTCVCPPGTYGDSCEKSCSRGFYGKNCTQSCRCYNGATCSPTTGTCTCAVGFTGPQCKTRCLAGMYGKGCKNQCANCPSAKCNIFNGTCTCQGLDNCICAPGNAIRTAGCRVVCECNNGNCDPAGNGSCACWPGWQGTKCEQPCAKGKYGVGCSASCTCVHGKCDPVTGNCTCDKGYTGVNCDTHCSNKTYGSNCRLRCPQCDAHSYPGCHPETGTCVCVDGWTGAFCDRPCPQGKYGANCSFTCSCQNGGICDSVTGKCKCNPGFNGDVCQNKCPAGSWGLNCAKQCDCDPNGEGCSPEEGRCQCKPGFIGVKCRESCPKNTYGRNCTSKCQCDPVSSTCSPIDGKCWCSSGYTGTGCGEVCSAGFWGRGCTQSCQCNNRGTCNPINGQCDCDAGYTGSRCEIQCSQDIYWGKNCKNLCACGGATCDHRDGKCLCPAGNMGHSCEQGCDSAHFGFQCAQLCDCRNNAQCDSVSGACRCQPGWSGLKCSDPCPTGYFGVDCGQVCPVCENGGSCDTFTGNCRCTAAFTGPQCSQNKMMNVTPTDQPSIAKAQIQIQELKADFHFTKAEFTGLLVGFILLIVIAVVVTALIARRWYVGRFGGFTGAVKFKGEEVDLGETDIRSSSTPSSSNIGFDNPVHHEMFDDLDKKSTISDTTSGVHSTMDDSDDDDFFRSKT